MLYGRADGQCKRLAEKYGKPWIHLEGRNNEPVSLLVAIIAENGIRTLNVAGA
jgi:hypothetical protein